MKWKKNCFIIKTSRLYLEIHWTTSVSICRIVTGSRADRHRVDAREPLIRVKAEQTLGPRGSTQQGRVGACGFLQRPTDDRTYGTVQFQMVPPLRTYPRGGCGWRKVAGCGGRRPAEWVAVGRPTASLPLNFFFGRRHSSPAPFLWRDFFSKGQKPRTNWHYILKTRRHNTKPAAFHAYQTRPCVLSFEFYSFLLFPTG